MSDSRPDARRITLALQGGGAHGAFTWGVLDRLLEDERIAIEGISGTSAGALNGAVLAQGWLAGGAEGARRALDDFWHAVSRYAHLGPVQRTAIDQFFGNWNLDRSVGAYWLNWMGAMVSPYQTNPGNYHPLRGVLEALIDISAIRACQEIKLFVGATSVRTGRARIFERHELTIDALLASACLPNVFQAVEIDGEPYWDGGYMGNPAIWPLIYHCGSADVVLVQVNPLVREGVPRTAMEIENRKNEIAFNSSLMHEMRAIAFVQRLVEEGALNEAFAPRYRNMRIHMIADEPRMKELGVSSKSNANRDFLEYLKGLGRGCATRWLDARFSDIGVRSSVDVRGTFL